MAVTYVTKLSMNAFINTGIEDIIIYIVLFFIRKRRTGSSCSYVIMNLDNKYIDDIIILDFFFIP